MKRWFVGFALVLAACNGEPTCPDGGTCPEGDGGGGETGFLKNAGFEDGTTGWFAMNATVSADTSAPHSGTAAAKLAVGTPSGDANLWYDGDAVTDASLGTYCARAWVRGTGEVVRLGVRRVPSSGGQLEEVSMSAPLEEQWFSIPTVSFGGLKVETEAQDRLLLRIYIPSPRAGDVLYVDDVELWKSDTGACK